MVRMRQLGLMVAMVLFSIALTFPVLSFAQTTAATCLGAEGNCNGDGASASTQTSSQFVPLANYDKSPQFKNLFNSQGGLSDYLSNVFKIVLSVGAILAVLRIAYGGYIYMGSADMWGNKQQAREIIGDAIIGLLLLFGIYLILYQINPNLLNLGILNDIKQAPTTSSTSSTSNNSATTQNNVTVTKEQDPLTGNCYTNIVDTNTGGLMELPC